MAHSKSKRRRREFEVQDDGRSKWGCMCSKWAGAHSKWARRAGAGVRSAGREEVRRAGRAFEVGGLIGLLPVVIVEEAWAFGEGGSASELKVSERVSRRVSRL
jgi:hypothetical protein